MIESSEVLDRNQEDGFRKTFWVHCGTPTCIAYVHVGVLGIDRAETMEGMFASPEAAAEAWNRRAPVQEAEAVVSAYEKVRRLGMLSKTVGDEVWIAASDEFTKCLREYRRNFPKPQSTNES